MTEGLPTLCNSTIRLLHALTQKYLSSTFFRTPDSQEQEVYANGENNVGDTDDNWIVECEPNTRHGYSWRWDWIANKYALFKYDHTLHKNRAQFVLDTNNNYWRPSTVVRFFHPNSNKYLTFNKVDITARVCPLCYRNKHKEISSTLYDTKGDSQRFHVKRQTRALIECSKTRDLLPKRWRMANRVLHTGDYVVWRNTSMNPCDVTGPHPVNHVDWMPDTRFGKVISSPTFSVECWHPLFGLGGAALLWRKFCCACWGVLGKVKCVFSKDPTLHFNSDARRTRFRHNHCAWAFVHVVWATNIPRLKQNMGKGLFWWCCRLHANLIPKLISTGAFACLLPLSRLRPEFYLLLRKSGNLELKKN